MVAILIVCVLLSLYSAGRSKNISIFFGMSGKWNIIEKGEKVVFRYFLTSN